MKTTSRVCVTQIGLSVSKKGSSSHNLESLYLYGKQRNEDTSTSILGNGCFELNQVRVRNSKEKYLSI